MISKQQGRRSLGLVFRDKPKESLPSARPGTARIAAFFLHSVLVLYRVFA